MRVIVGLCAILFYSACGARSTQKPLTDHDAARVLISKQDLPHAYDLGLEIEGRSGEDYIAFTPQGNLDQLRKIVPSVIVQTENIADEIDEHFKNHPELVDSSYNWDRVQQDAMAWSQAHSDFVIVEVYGKSTGNRPLTAIRISSRDRKGSDAPGIMITGATHGNEILTVDTVMGIAKHVIQNYESSRIQAIVASHDIWFIPVVSPDSYVARQRYVDSVDPNRDYPWPERPTRETTNVIKSLMNFFDAREMHGSLDYHSVASVVMWPWAYTYNKPSDDAKFRSIARSMAETSNYRTGQISEVMYIAKGSSCDYYYWKQNTLAMAIELSQSLPTAQSSGEQMVRENLESTLKFMEAVVKDHGI